MHLYIYIYIYIYMHGQWQKCYDGQFIHEIFMIDYMIEHKRQFVNYIFNAFMHAVKSDYRALYSSVANWNYVFIEMQTLTQA